MSGFFPAGQFPATTAGQVALTVDGLVHSGWLSMRLAHSIEAAASKFTLELTERWTRGGAAPSQSGSSAAGDGRLERRIRPAERCIIALDGEEVLSGHIDGVDADYDATRHTLSVTGRDLVGDLVDGAAAIEPPFEWRAIKLDELARRVCAPFNIEVVASVDCGAPFPRAAIQPGETAWEVIERGCRQRGLIATGDGRGRLLITKAGAGGEGAGMLRLGGEDGNILSAQGRFDWSGRHDLVVVRGQGEGGKAGQGEARARDAEVTRHRPRLLVAEAAAAPGAPDFQTRADWEVRTAAARSRRVTYTVPGWRGPSGRLWRINTLVPVRDAYLGLDRTMLVAGVAFRLDSDQGSRTELEMAPPEAFLRLPQPEPAPSGGGGNGGGGPAVGLYERADGARDEGAGAGLRRRTDVPALPPSNPGAPRR